MGKKSMIVNSHDMTCNTEYTLWVEDLKQSYRTAQANAILKTNFEKLKWYWNTGGELVTRKAEERWGAGVVEQVSLDLQAEFPNSKGLSADNLWAMKRWYSFYANKIRDEKLVRCVQELYNAGIQTEKVDIAPFPDIFGLVPWGHHLDIIRLTDTLPEAVFYIKQTIQEGWKRPVLQRYLKAQLYDKQGGAISNFKEQLPAKQAELVQEITKENYDFVALYHEWRNGFLRLRCQSIFSELVIHSNGDVPLCQNLDLVLGNIHQQSLDEIFNSRPSCELQCRYSRECNGCWVNFHRKYDIILLRELEKLFPKRWIERFYGKYQWSVDATETYRQHFNRIEK